MPIPQTPTHHRRVDAMAGIGPAPVAHNHPRNPRRFAQNIWTRGHSSTPHDCPYSIHANARRLAIPTSGLNHTVRTEFELPARRAGFSHSFRGAIEQTDR